MNDTDTKNIALAQIAATIITNSHPKFAGCDAHEAVLMARELLAEVEHPSLAPLEKKITGPSGYTQTRPRRLGWYDPKDPDGAIARNTHGS